MIHTFLTSFLPRSKVDSYIKDILDEIIKLTGSEYGFFAISDGVEFCSKTPVEDCSVAGVIDRLWERVREEKDAIILNRVEEARPIRRVMLVPIMQNDEIVFLVGVANKKSDYTEDDARTVKVLLTTFYNYTILTEQLFKKLIDSTGTGILVIDENRKIIFANDHIERMFGVKPENAIGRDFTEFVLKKDRERLIEYHRLQRIDSNLVTKSFELTLLTIDHRRVDVLVTTDLIPQTELSIVSLIDITELKEKSRKLERALKRLEVLHRIDVDILRGRGLEEIMKTVMDSLREVVHVDMVFLMLYNQHAESFDVLGMGRAEKCRDLKPLSLRFLNSLKSGKIVRVDVIDTKNPTEHEAVMVEHGMRSYILSPLIVRGNLVGVLCLASKEERGFVEAVEFVQEVSSQLAITVNEMKLQEAKREAFKQIEHNIEQFAILVDHIRNPLAAAQGFTEVYIEDEIVKNKIKDQLNRIIELVKKLERGWVESENIREFLRRW